MSTINLLQPLLDGGLQRNNFFNGRLLSAEDLRTEQDASRAQQRALARASGDGVAWGLDVTLLASSAGAPRVRVGAGLALNRVGDLLQLPADADLALVPDSTVAAVSAGLFAACEQPRASATLSGAGAYLLVVSPVSGYSGSATVADPNTTRLGRGACGARYSVEGVRLRLVAIDMAATASLVPAAIDPGGGKQAALRSSLQALLAAGGAPARERLRNTLAHACYGSLSLVNAFTDPLRQAQQQPVWRSWGTPDALRERGDLSDCDVPLALVVLDNTDLRLLDVWAVRRKLVGEAAVNSWRTAAGPRRLAEGEAAFLQFQAQLEGLRAPGGAAPGAAAATLAASTCFDILPAAGWLPDGPGGFAWPSFLGPHAPPDETPADAALLRGLIERSWADDPVVLATQPRAALRVWRVPGQAFVVFTRSPAAELRLTLSPAPSPNQAVSTQLTPVAGAVVSTQRHLAGRIALAGLAPGSGAVVTLQAPDFQPPAPITTDLVAGRITELTLALQPLPDGSILVAAYDQASKQSIARQLQRVVADGAVSRVGDYQPATDRWLIRNLPAGRYTITGTADGYNPAVRTQVGPTVPNTVISTELLFSHIVDRLDQPPLCVALAGVKALKLAGLRLCMVLPAIAFDEAYYIAQQPTRLARSRAPTVRFGADYRGKTGQPAQASLQVIKGDDVLMFSAEPWRNMVLFDEGDKGQRAWLLAWRDWFAKVFHDAAIAKADPQVFIDRAYRRPAANTLIRETPPAYAVFGRFGVPLMIRPADGVTRAPVAITKALAYVPRQVREGLLAIGFETIDDIAWAWQDLIVDATGDPPNDARLLINESQKQVVKINDERSYYEGLDKPTNDKLVAAGLIDDRKIAASTVDKLKDVVGSEYLASRLITQAKAITGKTPVQK